MAFAQLSRQDNYEQQRLADRREDRFLKMQDGHNTHMFLNTCLAKAQDAEQMQ